MLSSLPFMILQSNSHLSGDTIALPSCCPFSNKWKFRQSVSVGWKRFISPCDRRLNMLFSGKINRTRGCGLRLLKDSAATVKHVLSATLCYADQKCIFGLRRLYTGTFIHFTYLMFLLYSFERDRVNPRSLPVATLSTKPSYIHSPTMWA